MPALPGSDRAVRKTGDRSHAVVATPVRSLSTPSTPFRFSLPAHSPMRATTLGLLLLAGSVTAQETPLPIPADGNPLASTDERLFPFPSRFYQRPDPTAPSGVRSAYPADIVATSGVAPAVDFATFNFADGHPPAAPLLVHFGIDVAERFLIDQHNTSESLRADSPIALFDLDTGERVPVLTEMDQNLRSERTRGRHALIIRPMQPMAMGHRHVAVLTTALRDADDQTIPVPPGFQALRDRVATQHETLESARSDYEELFGFLDDQGYRRDQLLLAFDFMVASRDVVLGGILSMREQALAQAARAPLAFEIDKVEREPNGNVDLLVEGRFEVPSFLDDDNSIERRPDGSAVMQGDTQWFPFTMVVPPNVRDRGKLPLVLFGHGIFGSGRRYLAGRLGRESIQPIAHRAGAVVVATDFIGLSRGDRGLLAGELLRDLNRIHVMTDRLQQSLINNLVLVETVLGALQRDPKLGLGRQPFLDPKKVFYYGVSLGGTQGISLVALSKRITRAFLAVPGGAWGTMLSRSIVFRPFKSLLDQFYPDPLLQQTFVSLMQSRFDGCDGVNLGPLVQRNPLPGSPTDRRVVLFEAIGDCQVPNIATRIVARAMGIRQLAPVVEPVFGLEQILGPTTEPVLVQLLMKSRVASYRPPETNVLPSEDNGTHSRSVRLETAVEQMITLMLRGVAGG